MSLRLYGASLRFFLIKYGNDKVQRGSSKESGPFVFYVIMGWI